MENYFVTLNNINVNEKTEKKNGLTYLSWAWAWGEFKKVCPDASYEVVKFDGKPYFFDPETGYMCYTKVTAGGITHEMWLPVMDGANKAMKNEAYIYTVKNPNFRYAKLHEDGKYYDSYGKEQPEYFEKVCEAATMFDVNKTIMRCLTKNLAMFGLGLYIYAGEDLPEDEKTSDGFIKPGPACECCGKEIFPHNNGKQSFTGQQIAEQTKKTYGKALCWKCAQEAKAASNA